jgi:cytochrome c553
MTLRVSLNDPRHARRCRLAVAAILMLAPLVAFAASDSAPLPIPDTVQQRVAACTACHGVHGEGSADSHFFPRLAGKPANYLARQLRYFQSGQRKYAPMQYIVQPLSPAYMHEIADYFSSQQVPYQRSAVPVLSAAVFQRGEQIVTHGNPAAQLPACESCHGRQLTGVEPNIPGLVGLPYDYVSSQLGSWRTGTRTSAAPDCMAQIANRLSPDDITAVSAWLASQQPPADAHAQPAGSVKPPLTCGVLDTKGSGA